MKFRTQPSNLTTRTLHFSAVCLLIATLAACGGGSGGEMGEGDDTQNGDNSGSDSQSLLQTDSDGDQLFDQEELDIGTDPNNPDTDGDGITDAQDDNDGDGVSNLQELLDGTDPANSLDFVADSANPGVEVPITEPDACIDPDSADGDWGNNCELRRFGTYARTSYVQGVQRILWCQGFNGGDTFEVFADGVLGPKTATAIEQFQSANSLDPDGVVGPATWSALYDKLTLTASFASFDTYQIEGCEAMGTQFFQATDGLQLLGWTMAKTPGSTEQVAFSSGPPH